MFPANIITQAVSRAVIQAGMLSERSAGWKWLDAILLVPVPFALTVLQYFLIGLLIDRLVRLRLKNRHRVPG